MNDAVSRGMTYFRFAASHFWPAEQNSSFLKSSADEAKYWKRMDELFSDAEVLNVTLIPSLNWCLFLWPDLAREPLRELFTNSSSKSSQLLKVYVQKFVRRYESSTAVLAWELGRIANTGLQFISSYW